MYRGAMRAIIVVLCATAATAYGDAKQDVEALVRAEAQRPLADRRPERTKDAIEVVPIAMGQSERIAFYGALADKIAHKVDKVVVGVVGSRAWFHAVVAGSFELAHCDATGDHCGKSTNEKVTWRLSGVAIDDHGWKLGAVMWSRALPDVELMKLGEADAPHELTLDPHDDAAKVVAGWFAGGDAIAKVISSSAQAIANGTAPGEIAQGAAAGKLAKAWDGLQMWATRVEGKQWGAITFVTAKVYLPVKTTKTAVPMKLGVVLVQENGNWRWVSINFARADL
jgi:hypothetical protein